MPSGAPARDTGGFGDEAFPLFWGARPAGACTLGADPFGKDPAPDRSPDAHRARDARRP